MTQGWTVGLLLLLPASARPAEDIGPAEAGKLRIGIVYFLSTPDNLDPGREGAVVRYLIPGSPAARSTLEFGAVVDQVDGVKVSNAFEAVAQLAKPIPPGACHSVRFWVGHAPRTTCLKGEPPPPGDSGVGALASREEPVVKVIRPGQSPLERVYSMRGMTFRDLLQKLAAELGPEAKVLVDAVALEGLQPPVRCGRLSELIASGGFTDKSSYNVFVQPAGAPDRCVDGHLRRASRGR